MSGSRIGRGVGRRAAVLLVVIAVGASGAALAACGSSASATPTQNLNAGIKAQDDGNYVQAQKDYQLVVDAEPNDVYALYDLGDVEQYQKLDSEAGTHYLAALAVDPNYVPALYNMATLVATAHPTEAEAFYNQVITLDSKDANARFNLGYVLIALHQKKAGEAQIKLAVKLDPALKSRVTPGT